MLLAAGVVLAWVGLLLPWNHWHAEAIGETRDAANSGSVAGFAEARPFWIALAIVTPLAVAAIVWRKRWMAAALAGGALVLVALATREIASSLADATPFVSVGPGAGAVLSMVGAVALLAVSLAYVLGPSPRVGRLAGVVCVAAIVVAVAAAWPTADERPGAGRIADVALIAAQQMAFDHGTLYATEYTGTAVKALPVSDHLYPVADLHDPVWRQGTSRFSAAGATGLAIQGDELYVGMWGPERLVSASSGGARRVLVSPPPRRIRDEEAIESAPGHPGPLVVTGFSPGRLAPARGSGVYVLLKNRVALWRSDRLTTVAGNLDNPQDIATGRDGRLYIADTSNGRVQRVDADGSIRTVVGTAAAPGCVPRGLDDPLALDARRCIGVQALTVDDAGNLYLAVRGVATILGVTPAGRVWVVAGTGPVGFNEGDGRAVNVRLGNVHSLAIGPDGDLYLAESAPLERVRRIADPAGTLETARGAENHQPASTPACAAIARVTSEAVQASDVDIRSPDDVRARMIALERSLRALAGVAPDSIRDDAERIAAGYGEHRKRVAALGYDVAHLSQEQLRELDSADVVDDTGSDDDGDSIGDYAEDPCELVAGYDVGVDETNRFCLGYQHYMDTTHSDDTTKESTRAAAARARAFAGVADVAPEILSGAARGAREGLERAGKGAASARERQQVATQLGTIETVARKVCALDFGA